MPDAAPTSSAVANAARLGRLMRLVRVCFRDMTVAAGRLHADLGINASTRAVLEFLAENGPATVPEIARSRNVSRQHIQQLADALVAAGYCACAGNPAHRRSQLLQMTETGRVVFAAAMAREKVYLERMSAEFPAGDLARAADALERFHALLEQETDST